MLYDVNKNFMSRAGATGTTLFDGSNIPNLGYFRISRATPPEDIMVNWGDTLQPFEKYYKKLKNDNLPLININDINNFTVNPEQQVEFKKSNNIFNKLTVLEDKSLDLQGNIIDDTNWVVSQKIKAQGSKVAMTTDYQVRWAIYDENDRMLARAGKNVGATNLLELDKLPHADYFILSVTKNAKDKIMVNYGTTPLPYEDFGYTLTSTNEYPIKISEEIVPQPDLSNLNQTVLEGNLVDLSNTQQLNQEKVSNYASGSTTEIFNTISKTQLDYIELSANNSKIGFELTYLDKDGNKVTDSVIKPDDNTKLPLTIENMVTYGHPNVEFLIYDPVRTQFKIAIKNLNFSNGFTLSVKNDHTTTINATVRLVGRYYA